MKKIILLILIISYSFQINAQSSIIDLQARDGTRLSGAYYKDLYNILNPFEGTWLYTNGNTSLKIVLVKKTMVPGYYYEDLFIGEYQYIENGVEKFNSLNDLNTIFPHDSYHNIHGNHIPPISVFDGGIPGEITLSLSFKDNVGGSIDIRKIIVGGQQAIEIWKVGRQARVVHPEIPLIPIVPGGAYILIKQ